MRKIDKTKKISDKEKADIFKSVYRDKLFSFGEMQLPDQIPQILEKILKSNKQSKIIYTCTIISTLSALVTIFIAFKDIIKSLLPF